MLIGGIRTSFCRPNIFLSSCSTIGNRLHSLNNEIGKTGKVVLLSNFKPNSPSSLPLVFQPRRSTGFYSRLTAADLWKSETSVSNAGMKRGRGSRNRRSQAKDFNKGQVIGRGKINMVWPGLNTRVLDKQHLAKQKRLPPDDEYMANVIKLRETHAAGSKKGFFSVDPLDRGWAGTRLPGKKIGPPKAYASENFDGFETIVLESKVVTRMDSKMGRKRSQSMLVVTGNGNGIAGFALGKATTTFNLLGITKSRAGQRLIYIERCEDRTVFHDFHTQFRNTEIFVKRKPEGYGLKCHRGIKAICDVLGIKDLHAKIEGSTNILCITRAFFIGLLNQRTHQQLAEEKGLHVVKIESGFLPTVLASPKNKAIRTPEEIPRTEELDYDIYAMGGKIPLVRPKPPPFYTKFPSWQVHLKKIHKNRNHEQIKHDLMVEYGQVRSFLYDQYPECIAYTHPPPEAEE